MARLRLDRLIRASRSLRFEVAALGIALTILMVGMEAAGYLGPLERFLGDWRTRLFQRGYPDPKDRLVYVDLDDASLIAVGRWPWPRTRQAALLDELARAKPKVVGLDIVESQVENTTPKYEKAADGSMHLIEGDRVLAETLARMGNVTLAGSVRNQEEERLTAGEKALLEVLRERPTLEQSEAMASVAAKAEMSPQAKAEVAASYLKIRRLAVESRVNEMMTGAGGTRASREQLYAALGADPNVRGPLHRLIDEAQAQAESVRELGRFCAPRSSEILPVYSKPVDLVPLPEFLQAADGAGAVTYLPDASPDGRIRSVPLLVGVEGKLLPELGLALACKQLGVDVGRLRVGQDAVVLPAPGGDIRIPVNTRAMGQFGDVALMFDLPWFGGRDWKTMYDPAGKVYADRIPITLLDDAMSTRDRIRQNLEQADDAVACLLGTEDSHPELLRSYLADAKAAPDEWGLRARAIDRIIEDHKLDFGEPPQPPDPAGSERDQRIARAWAHVHDARRLNEVPALQAQLIELRKRIAANVAGKSVLIGWTANAVAADFVATPLHSKCPGVVVHGVVFNAVMTQAFVHPAPQWVTLAAALFAGLVTTAGVCWPSIIRGLAGVVVVAAAYNAFDAMFLYRDHGIAVGLAGPTAAGVAVWSVCTLARFLKERRDREALKRRFQSYVDPKIVQYVLEHPDQVSFAGQQREMTVVFTDLVGFTGISEKLGPRTVELLNEYFGIMVPIIRANRGVLNKFLGDGMMFFFNAPQDNSTHARDAVTAVLEMQVALRSFNESLIGRGLPRVEMRAGITSGSMIVGDAGPADAADYTVLGDNVNTAARLESANKAAGTQILCSERTVQLLGRGFLVRPMGRLQVVGKTEWVMTYEIICLEADATAEQRQTVEVTTRLVDAYIAGDFATCEAACDDLEQLGGGSDKLQELYRRMCDQCREPGRMADFKGEVVLAEK